eukprot:CAMPEP_0168806422 /NCGR_PEP_ID=MMETSP0726-20121227/1537_1 /TAXON_ID=265536 /ORGANISM="Amphiprora sp., Strain CCMP467" /LENGTH=125 /DNA_ID=CAMNT_0008858325 /DNA_START=29 /DNA_END=406 /DNA_ORIENTATION=-
MYHRWMTLLIIVLVVLKTVECQGSRTLDLEATRTEMIESRNRRAKELEKMLNVAKEQLKQHKSGQKLLDDAEKKKLERQIDMFERKMEHLLKEPDDKEVKRVLHREQERDERVLARRAQQEKEEL